MRRASRRIFLHGAAGLLLAAATRAKADTMTPELKADVRVADDRLILAYRLGNPGPTPLLVFDRLYQTARSGARTVDPALAYVAIEDGRLVALKAFVPPPPDIDVEMPDVPYARLLAPGGSLAGTAGVWLPARPFLPHARVEAHGGTAHGVELRIGYAAVPGELPGREIAADGEVVISVRPGFAAERQQIAAAVFAGVSVPLAEGQRAG